MGPGGAIVTAMVVLAMLLPPVVEVVTVYTRGRAVERGGEKEGGQRQR